jgi:hypothetical protein
MEKGFALSCGCRSEWGGVPAEWDSDHGIESGLICERHWHVYDARSPSATPIAWRFRAKGLPEGAEWRVTDDVELANWMLGTGRWDLIPLVEAAMDRDWIQNK